MAVVKKAPGRPSRKEKVRASNENIETTKTEKTEKVIEVVKEVDNELEKLKAENEKLKKSTGKVIEVKTEQGKRQEIRSGKRNNVFDVYVKGKYRSMSKLAYEAVSKDPKLEVTLPKGSPLAVNLEPKEKPCEGC